MSDGNIELWVFNSFVLIFVLIVTAYPIVGINAFIIHLCKISNKTKSIEILTMNSSKIAVIYIQFIMNYIRGHNINKYPSIVARLVFASGNIMIIYNGYINMTGKEDLFFLLLTTLISLVALIPFWRFGHRLIDIDRELSSPILE